MDKPSVRVVRRDQLSDDTPQTPGLVRQVAFDSRNPDAQVLSAFLSTVLPGAATGAHHHRETGAVLLLKQLDPQEAGPSNAAGYTAARTWLPTERQGSVASLSSHEEAHWIGRDDNVGQRGLGLLGFGLASDAEALEFGAIMMKRTVAWAADNTPRDKVPDRLEEDVRLQDGRYRRLVQWSPESRAQRSPNMIVYKVTYETD